MSPNRVLPPVFVMNVYYTGIGIARNLHGRGIRVYGLSSEKNAPGLRSRFFDGIYYVPNGRDEPEALYQRLLEIRRFHKQAPLIFPTRDFDVLFLHQYRDQLAPSYCLPQAKGQAVSHLLDKFEIADVAERHRIHVPKTVTCASPQDLEKYGGLLTFPLVVKPRYAYQWRRKGSWEAVGERKAILVDSASQLLNEYHRIAPVTEEILLQEYVPGADNNLVSCCCYIDRDGELLGYFTTKKLCQDPPLFGTGCIVELIDIPEIVAPSVQLLRACGYVGIAEIEFKYNEAMNQFFLIETNPRHWDQHELGKLAKMNLTWIAYQDLIGQRPEPQMPIYKTSTKFKWIAEREVFFSLARNMYSEAVAPRKTEKKIEKMVKAGAIVKKTLAELVCLLRGRKIFAILQLRDPVPGILMSFRLVREAIQAFPVRRRTVHTAGKIDEFTPSQL